MKIDRRRTAAHSDREAHRLESPSTAWWPRSSGPTRASTASATALVFGGGGSEAVEPTSSPGWGPARRRGSPVRRAALGEDVPRRPRHQAPGRRRLRARRARHRALGPRRARRHGFRSTSSGAPSLIAWPPTAAAAGQYAVADLIAEAKRYAAMGCRYYKMKIHDPDPRVNRQRVEACEGARPRRAPDGRRQPEARRAGRHPPGRSCWRTSTSSGSRSRCSPTTWRRARRSRAPSASGGHRREQLHALRVPRADRAARRALPHARRVPANGFSETLRIAHLAAAHEVLVSPHVVHELSLQSWRRDANGFLVEFMELDAARPVRRDAALRGRPFPHPDGPATGSPSRRARAKYRASYRAA